MKIDCEDVCVYHVESPDQEAGDDREEGAGQQLQEEAVEPKV